MNVYASVTDGRVWARCSLRQVKRYEGGVQEVVMDNRVKKAVLPPEEMCQEEGVDLSRVEDLCDLGHVHEASVLDTIEERFSSGREKPYTRAGEVVLAVNPYKWLPIYTEKIRREHDESRAKEAHVYSVSASAARGAARGDNQSILVSGESGAGKTETVKLVLGHLSSVSPASRRRRNVVDRVLRAGPLLESFGNAATLRNGNSSRFAKFLRVEMDRRDLSIVGSWCETALLEKTRVVDRVSGERSFHIFYELGESASYLRPLEPTAAASAKAARGGQDDEACLSVVRDSLALLNVTEDEAKQLFRAVRAVLVLGSVTFENYSRGDKEGCRAIGIEAAASALGISSNALLEQGLVAREVRGHEILLDAASAAASRDALAKELYRRVFQAVVELSNAATNAAENGAENLPPPPPEQRVVVGMLDLFGFEFYSASNGQQQNKNGFEQLLINFANERLQQRFVADVLARAQQELVAEGVPWQEVEFDDNAEILRLIEGRAGLVDVLNEECIRGASGNDANFVDKLLALHRDHPHLSTPKIRSRDDKSSALPFSISHYAGLVTYAADRWVDTNRDVLPSKLEHALVSSAEAEERTARVGSPAKLFSTYVGRSAAHGKKKKAGGGLFSASSTVASKFRTQLRDLMASIAETKCRYVRCVRPNNAARPMGADGAFDRVSVVEQLRCCGVLAALRVARAGYPDRKPLKYFVERFAICSRLPPEVLADCRSQARRIGGAIGGGLEEADDDDEFALDPSLVASCAPWREAASQIIRSIDDAQSRGYASPVSRRRRKKKKESNTLSMRVFIGKTKVFLRDGALDDLEKLRANACYESAATIQSGFRGRKERRAFLRARAGAVAVAALARQFLAKRRTRAMRARRNAAVRIACLARGRAVRKRGYFRRGRIAAIVLETCVARPLIARAKVRRVRVARAQGKRLDDITAKLRGISSAKIVGVSGSPTQQRQQPTHKKIFSRPGGSSSSSREMDLVRAEAAATVAAAKEVAFDASRALDELRRENEALRERCAAAEGRAETWRAATTKSKQREAQLMAVVEEFRRVAVVAHESGRKAHVAATITQNGSEAANAYSRLRQQMLNASNVTPELRKRILEKRRPNRSVIITRQQLHNFRRMLVDHGLDVLKHSGGKSFKRRLKLTEAGELYWTMPDGHSAARSKELYPLSECTEVRAAHDVDPDSTANKLVCGTKTLRRSMEAKNWACAFSFIYPSRTIDIQLATPEDTKVALRYCKAIVQEARTTALKVLLEQEDTDEVDDHGIPFSPHSPEHIIIK